MIDKINHYSIENPATIYDEEAMTSLELAGRTAAKVNEIVGDQNKLRQETEEHLEAQDESIRVMNEETMPGKVTEEVQEQIDNGSFDRAIDEYAGELEARLNNLLANTPEGSTTMDAEIIDARIGYNGNSFSNLGVAIREQIKIFARRYRNHVRSCVGTFTFTVDTTQKTISFHPTATTILYGNVNYVVVPSGDYTLDYSEFVRSTFMLNYNTSTKSFYLAKLDASLMTESDFIVCYFYASGDTGAIAQIIGCDDILKSVRVDGDVYTKTISGEVVDARTGYDGTLFDTLGYALREQFKKFAQRYRNHVRACHQNVDFLFNTANNTLSVNTPSAVLMFANNIYFYLTTGEHVLDYSDYMGKSGNTFLVMWSLANNSLYAVDFEAGKITESDPVLFTVYLKATGEIRQIVACDDLLKNAYIDNMAYLTNTDQSSGNKTTAKIFKKVVCCGDSFTSGNITDASGQQHPTNEDFAWPHYMSTATGNEWVNCGSSGANVLTWQTAERGLPKAQASGKAQAYVIGLMINDRAEGTSRFVELGSISDIGTNAQTYYGGLGQIIDSLVAISPNAKIFVCTCPNTNGLYPSYNQAVYDVVEHYKDTYAVHCLDLLANKKLYQNASLTADSLNGHYTASGYEQFAEIMMEVMSSYINTHIDDFQDVAFIEYE